MPPVRALFHGGQVVLGYTKECLREDNWVDLVDKLRRCGRAGIDTESDGPVLITGQIKKLKTRPNEDKRLKFIDMYRSTTVGFSVAFPDKTAYYVPLQHRLNNVPYHWGFRALVEMLQVSRDEGLPIAAHNLSQELKAFVRLNIDTRDLLGLRGSLHCTLVSSWMAGYDSNYGENLGLKELSKRILGYEMSSFDSVVGGTGSFGVLNPRDEEPLNYACEDAIGALELMGHTRPTLKAWGLEDWFNEVEMPFVWVLNHCSDTGISINSKGFRDLYEQAAEEVWRTKELGQELMGVDISSTKQLQKLFEEGYWLPVGEKGKSGQYGINQGTWEKIKAGIHNVEEQEKRELGLEMAKLLDDYKDVQKVYSTYSMNLVRLAAHSHDGKLHPDFKHAGVSTGRIAASNPNSTNMPSRGKTAPKIVENLIAPEGMTLISADYSQIDLRVLAHFSGGLTQLAFKDVTRDPHQELADDIAVTRNSAKTVMYLTVYGGGAGRLANVLGISPTEAKSILKNFRQAREEIPALSKRIARSAYRKGYVKTLSGRRKQFPLLKKQDPGRISKLPWENMLKRRCAAEERKAGNLVPQGGAADIVKYAMVQFYLNEGCGKGDPWAPEMVTQIHDDIRIQCLDGSVKSHMLSLQETMEAAGKNKFWELAVPLVAEPVSGKSWKELKE